MMETVDTAAARVRLHNLLIESIREIPSDYVIIFYRLCQTCNRLAFDVDQKILGAEGREEREWFGVQFAASNHYK